MVSDMKILSQMTKNVAAQADGRWSPRTAKILRARTDGGQSLVEFVLVLPVLLVLVFGIIEFANAWRTSQIVTNAAREGARMAVLPDNPSYGEIETRINNYLTNSDLDPAKATVSVRCDTDNDDDFNDEAADTPCNQPANSGDAERINVTYDFTFSFLGPMINFMRGSGGDQYGTITLDATTIMRNE